MTSGIALALDHADADLFDQLYRVWRKHRTRNMTLSTYYDGESGLKDFGISLPPQMRDIKSALGWSAKGVHAVTDRSIFEGFVSTSGDELGADQIADENDLEVEFPAAKVSSAVHGCSFLTVSQGDVLSGEPAQLIIPRAADASAAIWDPRRRELAGFLSVSGATGIGEPTGFVMYTRDKVVSLEKVSRVWGASWKASVIRNPLGRVSVAPLPHQYELSRPFGHTRLTRASRGFADSGLRTIVRAEVSAEFYSAPEYFLFGTDVSGFAGDDKWSAIMGRIKAWDYDAESGEPAPTLHRFNGASPQPHTDQLRMWMQLFADDQDLDVKMADSSNPSSADAIFAAKETLITSTREKNKLWGRGLVRATRLAMMLRDGTTEVTDEMRGLRALFTDPAIVSPSARADAYSKIAAHDPDFATSRVGRQYAGLSLEQITLLESEGQKRESASRLTMLAEAAKSLRGSDGNGISGGGVQAGESGSNAAGTVPTAGLPQ